MAKKKTSKRSTGLNNPTKPLRAVDLINFGGDTTDAGVVVTKHNAMSISAVNACVRRIAADLGGLPFFVYQKETRGRRKATDHPIYKLLHGQPNEEMTPLIFKETLTSHVLQYGNAYALIEKDGTRPIALWPLLPDRTRPVRIAGQLYYSTDVKYSDGTTRQENISPEFVLHIRGLTFDGINGLSVIEQAANTMGQSLAMQKYSSKFFANGGTFRGYLTHPSRLSKEAKQHLKETLSSFSGLDNAHGTPLFEEGLDYKPIGVPPVQAQWVSSMQFNTIEICRLFQMPPHKIGEMGRATWNNLEEENISYVESTLMRWIKAWEEEINNKLFLEQEKESYYAEMSVDALKRGNQTQRYDSYTKGLMNGWLTANQICEWENLPVYEGGDIHYQPVNLTPVVGQIEQPTTEDELPDVGQFSLLLEDAYRRILTKEVNAIKRQVKKENTEENLAAWLEEFYSDHEATVRQTLTPVVMTMGISQKWTAEQITEQLNTLVRNHIERSITDLTNDMASIENTLAGWSTRSIEVANGN